MTQVVYAEPINNPGRKNDETDIYRNPGFDSKLF